MPDVQDNHARDVSSHPEEIRADCELRLGNLVTVNASARITPAGVISAGIAAAAIILAVGFLVSSRDGRNARRELDEREIRRLRDR
ncbi:MAG: hypothetical protein JNM20_06305 [Rhizobiales bacterium]|nr:hypothetical protein [Hyphomicrobiales bacterium]